MFYLKTHYLHSALFTRLCASANAGKKKIWGKSINESHLSKINHRNLLIPDNVACYKIKIAFLMYFFLTVFPSFIAFFCILNTDQIRISIAPAKTDKTWSGPQSLSF